MQRHPSELTWTATADDGVELKLFAAGDAEDPTRTSLVRLAAGATWSPVSPDEGLEAYVLEGTWVTDRGALGPHGYARRAPAHECRTSSPDGCLLFVKCGPLAGGEELQLQADREPWLPGHGNLQVKPLSSRAGSGTALVRWPANERFVQHQHWGGEEILVLSGTFRDEHGSYPAGTWLRSSHLSVHHPFVIEETVILVKTGHLAIAQS